MSTCISREGEYSDHETTEGNFICDRCGVLDEEGLFAERDALRAEVEHWKGKFTQESKPDPLAHALKVASIVGSVTPCSCNAQRQRAERAEAILAKVRGVAKLNAIAYHAMWNGDVERVFLDILAILDGDDAQ